MKEIIQVLFILIIPDPSKCMFQDSWYPRISLQINYEIRMSPCMNIKVVSNTKRNYVHHQICIIGSSSSRLLIGHQVQTMRQNCKGLGENTKISFLTFPWTIEQGNNRLKTYSERIILLIASTNYQSDRIGQGTPNLCERKTDLAPKMRRVHFRG